jgi:hypothetical protein
LRAVGKHPDEAQEDRQQEETDRRYYAIAAGEATQPPRNRGERDERDGPRHLLHDRCLERRNTSLELAVGAVNHARGHQSRQEEGRDSEQPGA